MGHSVVLWLEMGEKIKLTNCLNAFLRASV